MSFPLYSQTYQWIMTSSFFTTVDQPNLYRYIDINNTKVVGNYKYFWSRFDANNLYRNDGTRFNRTYFSYIKVDCDKKIWTNTLSQTFINGAMTENTVKNIHWNVLDRNSKDDEVILQFICN